MISIHASRILLDIEGTTSSVSYVFDVMFPYARRRLRPYLREHWNDAELQAALEQVARDAGVDSLARFCESSELPDCQDRVASHLEALMDDDVKATGLKEVQGILWRRGFFEGELRAHVFPDVPPMLQAWRRAGLDLRIYSSGSVAAQKLFFAHTIAGDLLEYFTGHYDTRVGSKRESVSYQRICEDWQAAPPSVVFLSDVVAELDAARAAGLSTVLVRRPGNTDPPPDHGHPEISTFHDLEVIPTSDE